MVCSNCNKELKPKDTCECGGCFCEQENCEHPKTGHHKYCHPQKEQPN